MQARRGELVDVLEGGPGSGLIAVLDGQPVGLVTWLADAETGSAWFADPRSGAGPAGPRNTAGSTGSAGPERAAEIRALAVAGEARRRGIGRALLAAAEDELRAAGLARAWLVTTNDNLAALALYQKAGWRLFALRTGALDDLRRTVKPSIPEIGEHGIPLRDELELTKEL